MNDTEKIRWYERRYGPVIEKRGMSKENLKNLFKRPTLQDIIIFIMLILIIFSAWAYQNDIAQYQEVIENPEELCRVYYAYTAHPDNSETYNILNTPELTDNGERKE